MPLPDRRPIICMVTDRRRFAAPSDVGRLKALVAAVEVAASAGVDLIQVRERDLEARDLARLVRDCLSAAAGTGAAVVVNDRADVALTAGAAGVHLRADSYGASRLREMVGPEFLIGRSIHAAGEIESQAAGLDYLSFGTVFPTGSKDAGHPVAGYAGLSRAVQAAPVPVLAIGGMTLAFLPQVARTGAAGFAAIGFFTADENDRGALAGKVQAARQALTRRDRCP